MSKHPAGYPKQHPGRRCRFALGTPLYLLFLMGIIGNQSQMPTIRGVTVQYDSFTSPQRMKETGAKLARVFTPKPLEQWCTHSGYKTYGEIPKDESLPYEFKSPKGLIYVKVPKTGSSTLAGVVDRIVWNHGHCDYQDQHIKRGAHRFYANRVVEKSFLLGSVRDPAARAVSRISFEQYSQHAEEPTDENVLRWLNDTRRQFGTVSEGQGGFQLNYLTLDAIKPWSSFQWETKETGEIPDPEKVEQDVRRVLEKYDFFAVVERMDESLVALQMLMPGVDITDLLTVDSKSSGSFYMTGTYGCVKTSKIPISPQVKNYLESDLWYAQNYGDYLLLAAANESLDRTIEALGRNKFEKNLAEFRKLKAQVNEACESQAFFACSPDGVPQREKMNCYKSDHGCGYGCIDEMLTKMSR